MTEQTQQNPGPRAPKERGLSFERLQQATIVSLLVVLAIYASWRSDTFLTWTNLVQNLFANAAPIGVMAIGMTFVMIAGGFDLSVASTTAVCTVVLVNTMNSLAPHGPVVAMTAGVVVAMLVGIILGGVNGVLIAYARVNPFVTTLSTMLIFRGLALILTDGGQSRMLEAEVAGFCRIYDTRLPLFGPDLSVPLPIVIFAVVFAAGYYLLKFTRFGHYIYAIGGNEQATWLAGVGTRRIKAATYVLSGLSCAIAAVLFLAYTSSAQAESHQGKELDVIAAVIVGGTPLGGGSGGLWATVTGLLLLRLINNLLTQFNVGPEYRQVITGLIILIVVTIDVLARRRSSRV